MFLPHKAFTGGLRKYLQYYRACVLSTPPTLSLLTISFLFRKVGRQLRWDSVSLLLACFLVLILHPFFFFNHDLSLPHIASVSLRRWSLDVDSIQSKKKKRREIKAFSLFQGTCQSSAAWMGLWVQARLCFLWWVPFYLQTPSVSAIGALRWLSAGESGAVSLAHCCASLLRVLSCCPTCTMRRRITAATRTTQCCCHCWRAAANPTLGQLSQTGCCVLETNDSDP